MSTISKSRRQVQVYSDPDPGTETRNGHGHIKSNRSSSSGCAAAADGNGCSTTREREKTQSVNVAFTMLRTLIPTEPVDRKLSKIETLRLASSYISHLSSQLSSDQVCGDHHPHEQGHSTPGTQNVSDNTDAQFHQSKICTFCLSESKKLKSNVPTGVHLPTAFESSPYLCHQFLDTFEQLDAVVTNGNGNRSQCSQPQQYYWQNSTDLI